MRILQTLEDIRCLAKAKTYPKPLTDYLEQNFYELHNAFCAKELPEAFTLADIGPLIILEPGDNLDDLSVIGLNSQDGGLTGAGPEFIDRLDLPGLEVYKAVIVYNNDYRVTIFLLPQIRDEKVRAWIADNLHQASS